MRKGPESLATRRAFTLVELAVAIGVGMSVAAMALLLFNQQLTFIRMFRVQDFLVKEAPMINNYVVRVLGSAEGYQLFRNLEAYGEGEDPVSGDADLLVLRFQEPDGSVRSSALSFEDPGDGLGLYHRRIDEDGNPLDPEWFLSRQPADITFSIDAGILRMTVAGPNGELITYCGTEQL